eukprot:3611131-Rhodomonas_salina.1
MFTCLPRACTLYRVWRVALLQAVGVDAPGDDDGGAADEDLGELLEEQDVECVECRRLIEQRRRER